MSNIADYNFLASFDDVPHISFDEVKKSDSPLFINMPRITKAPAHLHRSAIDSLMLIRRCAEEKEALHIEIKAVLKQYEILKEILHNCIAPDSKSYHKSLIYRHILDIEQQQSRFCQTIALIEKVEVNTPMLDEHVRLSEQNPFLSDDNEVLFDDIEVDLESELTMDYGKEIDENLPDSEENVDFDDGEYFSDDSDDDY